VAAAGTMVGNYYFFLFFSDFSVVSFGLSLGFPNSILDQSSERGKGFAVSLSPALSLSLVVWSLDRLVPGVFLCAFIAAVASF
jgi:hypothetical protein